jgi:hypothetical protein
MKNLKKTEEKRKTERTLETRKRKTIKKQSRW